MTDDIKNEFIKAIQEFDKNESIYGITGDCEYMI